MSRRIPLHLLWALALCLLAPAAARASTVMALDVPALTRGSELVIHGRVLQASSHPLPGTGRIVTDVEVSVDEVLVGAVSSPSVQVTVPGGIAGGLRQYVSGAPVLVPGEEVVLFLAHGTEGLRVVGLAQGAFRIQRSEAGQKVRATAVLPDDLRLVDPLSLQPVPGMSRTMELEELRAQVRQTQTSIPPYHRSRAPATEGAPEGRCLWWKEGSTLTFRQQQCMPGEADCAARQEAVRLALRSWDDVLTECASLRLSEGSATASRQVGYVLNGENENILVLRDRACTPQDSSESEDCWRYAAETLGLTTVTFQLRSGEILDADVELNAVAFASPSEAGDLQGTVTHELGHALGLDHSEDARSTMYPMSTPHQRLIDEGSRLAMCTIYPRGAPAVQCVTPEPDEPPPGPWGCSTANGGGTFLLSGLVALLASRRGKRENVG
ncbi:matrixin family metalloprotease [Archangium violaceum]|uniref:matrixin family metalloprotease n=1 Tax=Archangium violaceum TaxID=83451 RepID=UPI0036DB9D24